MCLSVFDPMKRVLYCGAFGLGDMVSSLPKWYEIYNSGYELYVLRYDKKYFKTLFDVGLVENFIKSNKIVKELLIIPYNKFKLLLFFILYFRKFDIVYIPIKTKINSILGRLLGKKTVFCFESINDTKKYDNLVGGQVGNGVLLYNYRDFFSGVVRENNIIKNFVNDSRYVVIYPGQFERSLLPIMWKKILNLIGEKGYKVLIVGGKREGRIFEDFPCLDKNIINCIDKTSFGELVSILENSSLNICCNGGIMWLSSLLNDKNIIINIVSGRILVPPVDGKNSFLFTSNLLCKRACEAPSYKFNGISGVPCCDFYGTGEEACCKKSIDIDAIMDKIKSSLL